MLLPVVSVRVVLVLKNNDLVGTLLFLSHYINLTRRRTSRVFLREFILALAHLKIAIREKSPHSLTPLRLRFDDI